jgi:hypothetical protein
MLEMDIPFLYELLDAKEKFLKERERVRAEYERNAMVNNKK